MTNADKPINPIVSATGYMTIEESDKITEGKYSGLSKREYFAGLAMQGFINNTNSAVFIAEKAVKLADELLIQLEKK